MSYTLGQAARATGKAKSTISRDIKSGRLQADKEDLRRRLDQATALLTDQRASPTSAWGRFLAWRRGR